MVEVRRFLADDGFDHSDYIINGETVIRKQESGYYWGEIPEPVMREVIRCLESGDRWLDTVERLVFPGFPRLRPMLTGINRTNWVEHLDSLPESILDVGSGWGHTSFQLAARFPDAEVLSLEEMTLRSKFQVLRREQEKVDNVGVLQANVFDLNFRPASFDLIYLCGVLEWLGVNEVYSMSPRDLQLLALQRMSNWLKPGGTIVVGIENRVGINMLMGSIDHSGLRFTSLMPRDLASTYLRLRTPAFRTNRKRLSYRTYTYSIAGYEHLFSDAGLSLRGFLAHPHYANPVAVVALDNNTIGESIGALYRPRGVRDALVTSLLLVLARLGLAKWFAPHFILFAKRDGDT